MTSKGLSYIPIVHGATAERPDEADTLEAATAIAETLRGLGYISDLVRVDLDFTPIEVLARRRPLVVFNLVEAINTDLRLQPFVPAVLDRLKIAYTGSNFDALVAAMSKVRCKHLLKAASVATPAWIDGIRNPLPPDTLVLVKSDSEHASVGIDSTSVVPAALAQETIRQRERAFGGRFFAEVFIEGREFNVAMLEGPAGPEVLPIPEIVFVGYPDGKPRIVDYDAKWSAESFAYNNTPRDFGIEKTDARLARKLKRMALDCWRAFGLAGYARVDFRVDAFGKPWVIDVNTNPCITPDAGFAVTASQAGLSYPAVVERIVQAALSPAIAAVQPSEAAADPVRDRERARTLAGAW